MRYDIVLVTYNSEKWLEGCIGALAKCDYSLSELNLIFVDNGSADGTINRLNELNKTHAGFGGFTVLQNQNNLGFGTACNIGAENGNAPFIFFLNTDTEVYSDVFTQLDTAMALHGDDAGAYECRQLPVETGHHFNPVTLETSWASGAALIVKRDAFNSVGGFDKHLFMYCEDVDLSWRLRAKGYKIYYCPFAMVIHYAYEGAGVLKLGEYSKGLLGNLLLRYKYGSLNDIVQGHKMYLGALRRPVHFDNVRKILLKNYLTHFFKMLPFFFWRFTHKEQFKKHTARFEGGFDADRGQYLLSTLKQTPLVSVIVRTFSRPESLRSCLTSLRNQTYKGFEVVICEDGKPSSDKLIREFSDLSINYICDGERKGRSKNGNAGLQAAKGEWCFFLDDDDFLYPDHIECMLCESEKKPDADLILGSAMAMFVEDGKAVELRPMVFDRIDIFTMCQSCRIPIQTGFFRKSLYEKCGGLLENLDANEDWGMWLKYLSVANRACNNKADIARMTSVFVQDASPELIKKRADAYAEYNKAFYNDDTLRFNISLAQMRGFYRGVIADVEHVYKTGQLDKFIERVKKDYDK